MGLAGTAGRVRNHLMQVTSRLCEAGSRLSRFTARTATAKSWCIDRKDAAATSRKQQTNQARSDASDTSFECSGFTKHDVNYVRERPIDIVFLRLV
jgi:hypothetical protein